MFVCDSGRQHHSNRTRTRHPKPIGQCRSTREASFILKSSVLSLAGAHWVRPALSHCAAGAAPALVCGQRYLPAYLILNTVSVDTMEWHTRHGVRSAVLINKLLKCSNALAVRDLPQSRLRGSRQRLPQLCFQVTGVLSPEIRRSVLPCLLARTIDTTSPSSSSQESELEPMDR